MPDELHAIRLTGTSSATVACDGCTYHADTYDAAVIPSVLGDAAMHAASSGHVVQEHITRSVTVSPDP